MRSPGNRLLLERGLRAAAFVLLAVCAWLLATAAPRRGQAVARQGDLATELVRVSRDPSADSLHVSLRTAPAAAQRDWLAALARAGTAVNWSGTVPAAAVERFTVADPAGGLRVLAAAPGGAWVRLADSLGAIDSAVARRSGAAFLLAAQRGGLLMQASGQDLPVAAADSLAARHAVVLGRADWEARFVVTALEERGWSVDARLSVSPGIAVSQGQPLPLDTARHAVVVALDSLSASDAAALARFVARGGGVVLEATAARTAPAIAAGTVGPHLRAPLLSFSSGAPRRALAMDPVLPRGDALALERQDGHVVVAARRLGAGRVVQLGYDETWRWRMSTASEAVEQHREWWAGVVSAAAYRAETGDGGRGTGDGAPLASLVAALGPPHDAGMARGPGLDLSVLLPFIAALLFLCLLAEWASRRLRGAA